MDSYLNVTNNLFAHEFCVRKTFLYSRIGDYAIVLWIYKLMGLSNSINWEADNTYCHSSEQIIRSL